ncbi:MAG: type II toxin-antitoxin system prevent-host-death family antitoxin [Anaerolineales bacterium]
MTIAVNLSEARKNLPELTDRAYTGQTFVLSRRGRKLAVLMGIEKYKRLMELERLQAEQDWAILMEPPGPDAMSEDEAREFAVRVVREIRASRSQKNQ